MNDSVPPVGFLRKVHGLLVDVVSMFDSDPLEKLSGILLEIIRLEERTSSIDPQSFLNVCREMQEAIEDVVVLEPADSEKDFEDEMKLSTPKEILKSLFSKCENFHDVIHRRHISNVISDLKHPKKKLISTVYGILEKVASLTDPVTASSSCKLIFDRQNDALHFLIAPSLLQHPDIESIGWIRPQRTIERKVQYNRPCYSTIELESALEEYKDQCKTINAHIDTVLIQLRDQLKTKALVSVCKFSIALQSLVQHSWEATIRQWKLPKLVPQKPLRITEMWPYWLDRSNEKTVTNHLELKDMVLLTAPNMSGKSTVLRSIAAISILAMSGLHVPAKSVECPYIDHIVLRSFSGDNPMEQQSGFSMEMTEMRKAVEQCTGKSLILVDELGKGTEVKTGSGIAASLLEFFAAKSCIGMFSTHLHLIRKMSLKKERISFMKMNTHAIEPDDIEIPLETIHEPEWIVAPGVNLKSLALQVAWECGLAASLVEKAAQFENRLVQDRPSSSPLLIAESKSSQNGLRIEKEPIRLLPVENVSLSSNNGHREPFWDPEGRRSVEALLTEVCQSKGVLQEDHEFPVFRVKAGNVPSVRSAGRSCVYVLRFRSTGLYYVGQTDNLRNRLRQHPDKKLREIGGRTFEALYVFISKTDGGKSMGRSIETELIRMMEREGYPMASNYDKGNVSFGIRD